MDTRNDTLMNAQGCAVYETVRDSAAYLIGRMEGEKAAKEAMKNERE